MLTILLGPFGLDNFTHGEKVAGSEVFRQVSEWNPPYAPGNHFPPVWRFWLILYGSVFGLFMAGLFWLLMRRGAEEIPTPETPQRLHTSLFDVAMIAIGLAMTFLGAAVRSDLLHLRGTGVSNLDPVLPAGRYGSGPGHCPG